MKTSNYSVSTRWGSSEDEPSEARMAEILLELDTPDEEHPSACMHHHPTGWLLSLDEEGFAHLENVELDVESHMPHVARARALQLWVRFARGGPEAVQAEPWIAGPRQRTAEEWDQIVRRSEEIILQGDRAFFDLLGEEEPGTTCRAPKCTRGHISHSVHCRVHHFEAIQRKPCPFT
jgi:hypothetical protein